MVNILHEIRRHRRHTGNGRRLDFPHFDSGLFFDIRGLVVRNLHCVELRCAIPRAPYHFKDRVARGRRFPVGVDDREDRPLSPL